MLRLTLWGHRLTGLYRCVSASVTNCIQEISGLNLSASSEFSDQFTLNKATFDIIICLKFLAYSNKKRFMTQVKEV